jgi:hypothetical protein
MSLKDLFQVKKVLPPISSEQIAEEVESVELLDSHIKDKERIEFAVDYSDPANFSIFGSAEKYYNDSITRIYEQYPYDGSKKEKLDWYNSSSLLDIWFYENAYPRTTGYANFSPNGWSTPIGSQISGYGEPTTKEYIVVKGGPNTNTATTLKSKFEDVNNQNPKANIYNVDDNRTLNMALNGNSGASLEFWLKKDAFITGSTRKEVIFDLWNGETSSSVSYGRMTLLMSASTGSPFYLTVASGASGVSSLNIGSAITTSSVANGAWNHYTVTLKNNGSNLNVKLYVNGELNAETTTGTSIGNVTGSMVANIGALRTAPSGVSGVGLGWGKLSGSLDDFRFWKTERTARQIGRNWWANIGGGTNTDEANTTLGFYYKFNEGITTDNTIDSIVLDYSGRISNGSWVGYSSTSRNTGSAINDYTGRTLSTEEPDPIIYSTHPDVVDIIEEYTTVGKNYDTVNSNVMYYSFPNWIVEEDASGDLLNVTQIAASYLDTLYLQIKFLTTIKDQYTNIQIDEKPFPFSKSLLESMGIVAPSLFVDAKLMEEVLSRDEERNYEDKLNEIKNVIYQNIYSNLQSILKSKGTEKSVRNLLHCFGIDEELVKLSVYSNNDSLKVADNVSNLTVKKKSINLNDPDRFYSTIYQYKDPSNTASTSYISGATSTELDYVPYTFEAEVVFPRKLNNDQPNYFVTSFSSASIFGGHTAVSNADDYTWASPDYFGFKVLAVKDSENPNNARFCLQVPALSITLTSSLYTDVYQSERWNFAVRVKPSKLENANIVSGTTNATYTIDFYGVNTDGGVVVNEFSLSSSVSNANGKNFVRAAKRLYFGAERTNFTGSLVNATDIKLLNLRAWAAYLTNEDIQRHAADPMSYGIESLNENAYLTQTTFDNISVPKAETLLLDWQFDQITGSNSGSGVPGTSDGYFLVDDATGGSATYSKYNTVFNNLKKYQYVGKGDLFPQNDNTIIDTQYIFTSRLNHFEDIRNSQLVNILSVEEQTLFTRQTRPINYFFSFEKSMYRTISEQMLNMFGTILDFNNLVGEPVNKYRREYKSLGKLRQMFFEKVQNTPDLDKYLDFYKWIDSAVGKFLLQLVPASADTSDGLLNVIESHALERNKHQYKFPTIEFKAQVPETGFISVNKHLYNWRIGFRPLNNQEDDNCLYWSDRAERTTSPLSSSDAGVNNTRTKIFEAKAQALNRSYTTPLRLDVGFNKTIKGGVNFESSKNLDYVKIATEPHGPLDSDGIVQPPANYLFAGIVNTSSVLKDCDDILNPTQKKKYYFSTVHGRDYNATQTSTYSHVVSSRIALPANFVSASIQGGYHDYVSDQFMSGVDIVNIHNDTYGSSNEVPMQGPFTNQWVGGNQSRHITLNTGSDSYLTRPEAWKIALGVSGSSTDIYQTAVGWIGADYPYPEGNDFEPSYPVVAHKRATYFRDETAKRPVNIRNIRSSTGSVDLGNYSRNYQVVQTMGRTTNNRLLLDQVTPITSSELFGVVRTSVTSPRTDFTLVERPRTETVIGSRFSAPGDSRTLSRGFLNAYAEELSPYNAMSFRNRQVIGDGRRTADALTNDIERYNETVSGAVGKSLTALLAKPTSVGGYESGSTTVASLHKVNRNTLYTIDYSGSGTAVTADYDNGFVTHQIPQNDAGYAWIRAAISGTADDRNPAYFGHILTNYTVPSGTTSTTQSLSMISASLFGSTFNITNSLRTLGYDQSISGNNSSYLPVDFVGLNSNVYESASYTTLLATTGAYRDLAGGLLKTNDALAETTGAVVIGDQGIFFKPDGTKMFVYGEDGFAFFPRNERISEYNLSTAWDTTSAVFSQTGTLSLAAINSAYPTIFTYGANSGEGTFFEFSSDGSKLYVSWDNAYELYGIQISFFVQQYDLSSSWDISTLTLNSGSYALKNDIPPITHGTFSNDGTKIYCTDGTSIFKYNLSTAWDITTISSTYEGTFKFPSISLSSVDRIKFSSDGTRLYVYGIDNTSINTVPNYDQVVGNSSSQRTITRLNLSTAWDITTIQYDKIAIKENDNYLSSPQYRFWSSFAIGNENLSNGKIYYSFLTNGLSLVRTGSLVQYDYVYNRQVELNSSASMLNSLLSHRGGAYGYNVPNQVRNSDHPIVRVQRKDNYITVNTTEENVLIEREPVVYFNSPHELYIENKETNQIFEATYSYDNLLQSFENENLFNNLVQSKNTTFYEKAIKMLKNNDKYKFSKLVYKTSIYPKKKYSTLSDTRQRKYYSFSAWRDNREDRAKIYQVSDFNYGNFLVSYESIWPMDGRIYPNDIRTDYISYNQSFYGTIGAEGVLQNKTIFVWISGTTPQSTFSYLTSSITASVSYAAPHTLIDKGYNLFSRNSLLTSPLEQNTYFSYYPIYSGGVSATSSFRGEISFYEPRPDNTVTWTTVEHPNINYGPYDDSYSNWYETLRLKAKNYSVLPEYIISDDTRLSLLNAGKYRTSYANALTISGSSITGSNSQFDDLYIETDNLSNMDNIKQDLSSVTKTIKLTLDCDAFLKFNAKPELYPQVRTVKIAEKFMKTTLPYISFWSGSTSNIYNYQNNSEYPVALKSFINPLFAPGILYNTIKSGIAVDYPILTSSLTQSVFITAASSSFANWRNSNGIGNSNFDIRLPFETLLKPEAYLQQVIDMYADRWYSTTPEFHYNVNYTSSWTGEFLDNSYKLAINNFLAETIDFFAPEGKLTTLFSKPETEFKQVDPNKKYRALVKIYKSATNNNLKDYLNATGSNASTLYTRPQYTNKAIETITMYSRPSAFGPPSTNRNAISAGTVFQYLSRGSEFTYAPYTPPYYDGSAWALITFTPTGSKAHVPTLEEIQNNLEIKYLRLEETVNSGSDQYLAFGPVVHHNNAINNNAMQISASVDLLKFINTQEFTLNSTDATKTKAASKIWAIQTKFETPILNFNPADTGYTASFVSNVYYPSQQDLPTYGMWHQYGVIPDEGKGVYLQVTDIPKDYILYGNESSYKDLTDTAIKGNPALTASLADIVGFNKDPIKLGQVAAQKEIKEAVVAIPYILEKNQRKFFKLNKNAVNYINKQYFGKGKDIEKISENAALDVSKTILDQIQSLEDYVVPPAFDYLNNQDIEPISMYVFEFKYNLSQEDLSHIWQGVQPNIADKVENQKITISHELNVNELMDVDNLTENLQWLVFKIKKKAKTNYFNKVLQSAQEKDKRKEDNLLKLGRTKRAAANVQEDNELLYSYNWPYDYFSLVELAKIDAIIEFDGNEKVVTTITDDTDATTTNDSKPFINTGREFKNDERADDIRAMQEQRKKQEEEKKNRDRAAAVRDSLRADNKLQQRIEEEKKKNQDRSTAVRNTQPANNRLDQALEQQRQEREAQQSRQEAIQNAGKVNTGKVVEQAQQRREEQQSRQEAVQNAGKVNSSTAAQKIEQKQETRQAIQQERREAVQNAGRVNNQTASQQTQQKQETRQATQQERREAVQNTGRVGNRGNAGRGSSGGKLNDTEQQQEVDSNVGGGSVGGRGQGQVAGGTRNPFSAGTGEGITSDGVKKPSSGRDTTKNPKGGRR